MPVPLGHPNVRHWDNPRIKDYARTVEEAVGRSQFRFCEIVDLVTGQVILELGGPLLPPAAVRPAACRR